MMNYVMAALITWVALCCVVCAVGLAAFWRAWGRHRGGGAGPVRSGARLTDHRLSL